MFVKVRPWALMLPAILTGTLAITGLASAEAKKEDAAMLQTLRKAQGMLRQISQEKADLEAQTAKLQDQIKSLEAKVNELTPLQSEVREQKASLESMRSQNEGLQQRVSEDSDRYRSLADKQRNTLAELNKYKRDNLILVDAVKERVHWIEECTRKNGEMLTTNKELVGKYQNKGFWTQVKEIEPFIRISEVEKENEAQDYRYKLEDLEVTPWQDNAGNAQTVQPAGNGDEDDPDNAGK